MTTPGDPRSASGRDAVASLWLNPAEPAAPAGPAAPPGPVESPVDLEVGQRPLPAVFVGHDAELAELRRLVDAATRGRGSVVLVSGEPGIGKTRLAERAAGYALGRAVRVLWGSSWDGHGAPPYWPWVQLIRDYAVGRDVETLARELGEAAEDIARLVPEVERAVVAPGRQAGDARPARERLLDGLAAFLRRAADNQPLLVVLDDLDEVDRASLALLGFLAPRLATCRVVVLATYTAREPHPGHPLPGLLDDLAGVARHLVLNGLYEDDIARLIAATTTVLPDAQLVRSVHRRTAGNPLLIQDWLRRLAAEAGVPPPGGPGPAADGD